MGLIITPSLREGKLRTLSARVSWVACFLSQPRVRFVPTLFRCALDSGVGVIDERSRVALLPRPLSHSAPSSSARPVWLASHPLRSSAPPPFPCPPRLESAGAPKHISVPALSLKRSAPCPAPPSSGCAPWGLDATVLTTRPLPSLTRRGKRRRWWFRPIRPRQGSPPVEAPTPDVPASPSPSSVLPARGTKGGRPWRPRRGPSPRARLTRPGPCPILRRFTAREEEGWGVGAAGERCRRRLGSRAGARGWGCGRAGEWQHHHRLKKKRRRN